MDAPHLRGPPDERDEHPDVREHREERGHQEDGQLLDPPHLAVRDDGDAHADDEEQVEGGRADNGARAETLPPHGLRACARRGGREGARAHGGQHRRPAQQSSAAPHRRVSTACAPGSALAKPRHIAPRAERNSQCSARQGTGRPRVLHALPCGHRGLQACTRRRLTLPWPPCRQSPPGRGGQRQRSGAPPSGGAANPPAAHAEPRTRTRARAAAGCARRTQLPGGLDHSEQDLRRRRSERHERQVRHRVVPHVNLRAAGGGRQSRAAAGQGARGRPPRGRRVRVSERGVGWGGVTWAARRQPSVVRRTLRPADRSTVHTPPTRRALHHAPRVPSRGRPGWPRSTPAHPPRLAGRRARPILGRPRVGTPT